MITGPDNPVSAGTSTADLADRSTVGASATRFRVLLRASRGKAARRMQWGIVDQSVSSLTNFLVTLFVARQAGPRLFGGFSVVLTIYILLLWTSRSAITEPFVVRFTALPHEEQWAGARQMVGAAVSLGGLAAAIGIIASLLVSTETRPVVLAMAVPMPALLAQDAFRYVLFAAGRARSAAANDALWLVVQTTAMLGLALTGNSSASGFLACFGLGATVSAIVGAYQTWVRPLPSSSWRWMREHRDLAIPFLLELMAVAGMMQIAVLALAATAGVVAVGELRVAILLFGPLSLLFLGMFVVSLPEAVRLKEGPTASLLRVVLVLSLATSVFTALWTVALLLIPKSIGLDLLSSNWSPARRLLVPVAGLISGHACALAALVGLRALGAARESLRARLWGAPVFAVGGIIGSLVAGGYGAAVGLALGAWVDAGLTWSAFRRAISRHQRGQAERSPADAMAVTEPPAPPVAQPQWAP